MASFLVAGVILALTVIVGIAMIRPRAPRPSADADRNDSEET